MATPAEPRAPFHCTSLRHLADLELRKLTPSCRLVADNPGHTSANRSPEACATGEVLLKMVVCCHLERQRRK